MSKIELENKNIPFSEVASFPPPGMSIPSDFKFSFDDTYVAYIYDPENGLNRQLWLLNTLTNEQKLLFKSSDKESEDNISADEKLRRERQRMIGLGVIFFQWAEKVNHLVFSNSAGLFTIDFEKEHFEPKKIIDLTDKIIIDPQLSPDGKWICYVSNRELFITSFDGLETRQLTFDAKEKDVTNGDAEFVAQEEMRRKHGFWWSPDSQKIAFNQVDEKHIPLYRIIHQGKDKINEKDQDVYHYPFVGEKNAIVRLAVLDINNSDPIWMDLGPDEDIYLARVDWFSDIILTAQIENRKQSELILVKFDLSTGKQSLILKETNEIWINLHFLLRALKTPKYAEKFIWGSERTGYMHLYLYDFQGNFIKPLTTGEFIIEEITGINEEQGIIYVMSTAKSALESHLYSVTLSDGKMTQMTVEKGTHFVDMSHNCNYYIDTFSSLEKSSVVYLKSIFDDKKDSIVFDKKDQRIDQFDLKPPEIISIKTSNGVTLYGSIYKPDDSFMAPYPTIVQVYGGPGPQLVINSWGLTANLQKQNLRNHGFLIFTLDNRGSGRRGLAFQGVLKNQFGNIEIQDQVLGVEWLINRGLADKNRIGMYGWSYGGYMSLMCLAKAPHIFKAAMAGAPVNDHADYDTHYPEHYLGNPIENKEGYAKSCVANNLENMEGKLLIMHGLIDENVHFRHTAKIINALTKAKKTYSLIVFPDGRHSLRKKVDKEYREEKIFEFFKNNL